MKRKLTKYQIVAVSDDLFKSSKTVAEAYENGEKTIVFGLEAAFAFCGGKLPRVGYGYAGRNFERRIEYFVTKA